MAAAAIARGLLPLADKPVVRSVLKVTAVVLVPLNPRGISETEAIQIDARLWLVTKWHRIAAPRVLWRPMRMICIDAQDCSPMGPRLVLNVPMGQRVFRGQGNWPGYEIWLHPDIFVDFGSSFPAGPTTGRARRPASSHLLEGKK